MIRRTNRGFSLVELLISLTLGLIITSALVRVYQSNNKLQTYNYALSTIQEDGRYLLAVMRRSLMSVGDYNEFSANLNRDVDTTIEMEYVKGHPVVIEGEFAVDPTVGSIDRGNGNTDQLTVNIMASNACNGTDFDFNPDEEFHAVNQYFVENNALRCRGYDGRVLRGLKAPAGAPQAVTILNNVHDFQVLYGITQPIGGVETGYVTSWVTADRVTAFNRPDGNKAVVGVKLAVLIKNDDEINIESTRKVKLLGNPAYEVPSDGLYRVFETVILFRNSWNHIVVGM